MSMETFEDGNYGYGVGLFLLFLSVVWCFKCLLSYYILDRIRAWIVLKFEKQVEEWFIKEKTYMAHILNDYREKINRNLNILEIGSGPAVNTAYVPLGSNLSCLDPNPQFEEHVYRKMDVLNKSIKEIHFVRGYAENLPFGDGTFDAVICTLTMCVVADLKQSLEEIKRVLKPNGRLVFLEHIISKDETWSNKMIHLIISPLNWLLFGCHFNREIDKYIKEAGFSNVTMQNIYQKSAPFSLRRCILGEATK